MTSIRVNGVARHSVPKEGNLVINYKVAARLILASETNAKFSPQVMEELPAIVTHWLQSPKEKPPMLSPKYAESWINILRKFCESEEKSLITSQSSKAEHPRPVHIDFGSLEFPPTAKPDFTFIDLFAGIGGFRLALQEAGGKCVFTSEWDKAAKETYSRNYGEIPFGDIRKFTSDKLSDADIDALIPDHDILAGGFPCQPFSQAGRQLGFEDARGTLFFDILRIAKAKKPKVLFLENVKRLRGHDGGKTLRVITSSLREVGYKVYAKVLRAADFGVPQNRERIFIVAFKNPIDFDFPEKSPKPLYTKVGDILEAKVDSKYTLSEKLWKGHQRRLLEHKEKGNGFGFSLFSGESKYANTISARYYKDGSEILIQQKSKNPRKLSPRECARLQGFPDNFLYSLSDMQAYKQFGNSVAVPVVRCIATSILVALKNNKKSLELEPFEPLIY